MLIKAFPECASREIAMKDSDSMLAVPIFFFFFFCCPFFFEAQVCTLVLNLAIYDDQ